MSKVNPTYAELVQKVMRERKITRRDIEKATEYSYEHVRKVVAGMPLMSEAFNEKMCTYLRLDKDEMWRLALREKFQKHGPHMLAMVQPDMRLKEIWQAITREDQERLIKIGEGMAETRRAEAREREEDDPERIKARISFLMDKLLSVRVSEKSLPTQPPTKPDRS